MYFKNQFIKFVSLFIGVYSVIASAQSPTSGGAAEALTSDNLMNKKINQAFSKTIAGAIIFCAGEILNYAVVLPRDLELEDKLFDTFDEKTGKTVTYQQRAQELSDESMQLMLLGLPFSAMTIGGVTASCISATRSTFSTRKVTNNRLITNRVWIPYISGWAVGMVGSGAALISGLTESREPLGFARVCGVAQSALWATASIMAIAKTASNKKEAAQEKKLSFVPIVSSGRVQLLMEGQF